ncbi:MAG: DUF6458 family protein [Actinomycetota bacterium]|nr:DUF6458 family protein [Actinomycetota bacterium]
MGIGVSVFLLVLGAILTFAVHASVSGVSISTVGIILMVGGAIGLITTLIIFGGNRRGGAVTEERVVRDRDVY